MLDTPLGQWLLLVLLFVLGSLFGSFANVVIYRLPLGKSLLWPGSHCPACGHAIRWFDNVPVFGWLVLGGKCRDCRAAISVRYPLVEALFGILLAALGWLEIVSARSNLPEPSLMGVSSLPPSDWVLPAYHLLLLGTLVVAALIEWDGRRIGLRLLYVTLACGLLLPLAWGALRPVPLGIDLPASLRAQPVLRAMLEGLAGTGAGLLLGCLAWPAITQARAAPSQAPQCWPGPLAADFWVGKPPAELQSSLRFAICCPRSRLSPGRPPGGSVGARAWRWPRRFGWHAGRRLCCPASCRASAR